MNLENLRQKAYEELKKASSMEELEEVRLKYLGRKQGELTSFLRSFKDMSEDEKREYGPIAQRLKNELETEIDEREEILKKQEIGTIDLSIPGSAVESGRIHLLSKAYNEVCDIFHSMNFSVAEGPELEKEKYNFDSLNIPANHPAREMWDTFWVKNDLNTEGRVMRTHTSPVQVRYMLEHKPPFQMICPGRVFRYEATDATHETNFYQIEGLMIGKDISLANFKFVIEEFFRQFFKDDSIEVKFRASYFPFTEPSVEVDAKIGNKWLELGGAGMVHPKVLKEGGADSSKWQGFAFGFGLERLAVIKYGVPDVRLFMSGDERFTKQF